LKIHGIGSVERSWGDLKHLKTGKGLHLSAENVKMQAAIFGPSCGGRAAMMRRKAADDIESTLFKFWNKDDSDKEWSFDTHREAEEEESNKKTTRTLKLFF
jgi:hypothetical protein